MLVKSNNKNGIIIFFLQMFYYSEKKFIQEWGEESGRKKDSGV